MRTLLQSACLPAGVLTLVVSQAIPAGARNVERFCGYEVYVKSDRAAVRSTMLPNGRIRARGLYPGSREVHENLDRRAMARRLAAMAARECLSQAPYNPRVPAACRTLRQYADQGRLIAAGRGQVTNYRIGDMGAVARRTICQAASGRNLRRITGITIWTIRTHGNRSCNLGGNGRYHVVARNLSADCAGGGHAAPRPGQRVTSWARWSGSHHLRHASRLCRETPNGRRNVRGARVIRYEINRATGALRLRYRCW